MPDNVYAISEIVGSSTQSSDVAIENALTRARKSLRNLDWFEVVHTRGHLVDGQIAHWQVTLKVGFRMEE